MAGGSAAPTARSVCMYIHTARGKEAGEADAASVGRSSIGRSRRLTSRRYLGSAGLRQPPAQGRGGALEFA